MITSVKTWSLDCVLFGEDLVMTTRVQTSVNVVSTRLDPSKVGWEGADRFLLVYEWKPAQFTYTEPLKPALNCMTCFESLLIETRTPKHCILLVWQTNQVRLHHVKRESLSTQSVALASYLCSKNRMSQNKRSTVFCCHTNTMINDESIINKSLYSHFRSVPPLFNGEKFSYCVKIVSHSSL